MKAVPTLLQWIKSWFRLRTESPSGWYRWHEKEAHQWLDQATEDITSGTTKARLRNRGNGT